MKGKLRDICISAVSLIPMIMLTFLVFIPTIDLLVDPISQETADLLEPLVKSYMNDLSIDVNYLFTLAFVWAILIVIGSYLTIIWFGYIIEKMIDRYCGWGRK